MKEEAILEDILIKCKEEFLWEVVGVKSIKRGYLNLKWKVETTNGTFLVKQYNQKRLAKYDWHELQDALKRQIRLSDEGFPTPKLLNVGEEVILKSNDGELFVIMDYVEGDIISAGHVSAGQIYDLGLQTGKMHKWLNGEKSSVLVPAFNIPPKDVRIHFWQQKKEQTLDKTLFDLIEMQIALTKKIALTETSEIDAGWAHRDLWLDNVLFNESKVAAILDFDRLKYDYPLLDVARMIISATLLEGELQTELIDTFIDGYNKYHQLSKTQLIQSLRLLLYMESTWWITDKQELTSKPAQRFYEEMVWLTYHYDQLERILE
ncbi:hypothetical protein AJ85_17160 [Alkalihalobacillus alcalophilus ATCC 27647 = CGMCC 1.3604]|uniref:Protein kinase domain-containing protein n=1 Tax=Alkalihalobacillus alcalophilus ATCC 27647 = CGMCC 1.3604 TaxID=1218173 RepID=A0A094YQX3_ALKAL|nr:phosphotransferase [Alkalihalobacillus alcalophilus]KGA95857.1 hypothetical protein BALCAV_0219735 [Alkalihalobacillus alcalophilus ATCC 27647 = CGMCC 1.3604]MED1563958.1 phosphotransferase [Alkalihalobacillus alcalophilus]THG92091.1 hypothetical protein AJ85_17160 [Alkalihalobacillus alcalophilus ATCC 27647 = CGMCC 1.3604]